MGLNSLQRVLGDEECNLHRAVVSPKTHRAPRCVERATLIGKTHRHRSSFRSCLRREIAAKAAKRRASRYPLSRAKYLLHARAAAATPKQTAAANVRLNRVVHRSRSSRLQAGARPVSLPPAPVLLRFMVGDGRGCALSVALSRGVRSLSAITWHC